MFTPCQVCWMKLAEWCEAEACQDLREPVCPCQGFALPMALDKPWLYLDFCPAHILDRVRDRLLPCLVLVSKDVTVFSSHEKHPQFSQRVPFAC